MRLARLVGRGRALEILLGGDDIPAEFTDRFARRIAAFEKVPVAGIKTASN